MLMKVLLAVSVLIVVVSGAPWDRNVDCPAQGPHNPCRCSTETNIDCINQAASSIPTFIQTNWVYKRIDMSNNTITIIQSRAFSLINVSEIILASNLISSIERDAFQPLEKHLRVLDLSNNRITFLPETLGKLTALQFLDVSYNPIPDYNFTNEVLRELGDYVTEFRFGDNSLKRWPDSLHHLARLEILKFYGGSEDMDQIPMSAFSGFEWTLKKLWMQDTKLISVPIALQDLNSLEELHFDNNINVGDAGILIPAFAHLTDKLETMSLENNSLTTFPSVLLTLNQLHNLSLASNNLEFISDQAVAVVGSNITTINLQNCNLDRIPGALSKLTGLINLDFSYNKITTIEKNDLQRMDRLRTLNISYNPLQYISKSTFHDLKRLDEFILKETLLYQVPQAIVNIPTLRTLDLTTQNTNIECNCDLVWLHCYMKNNNTGLVIRGECETVFQDIQIYANKTIPNTCPVSC